MCGDIMKKVVINYIKEQSLIEKGSTILVGVSGGPDSMALLHLLVSLRESWKLRVIALTVDHQLRGSQSAEDVKYVQTLGKEWGVEVVSKAIDVLAYQKEQGVSKQVASRDLRYRFYEEEMNKYQADRLALGHHGDDQVETMLMSFTRSANPKGMLGIPLERDFAQGKIIRPLLAVSREQIEEYCKEAGIEARRDPSNLDLSDRRVFFRKRIVPLLRAKNPNVHRTVHQLSKTLTEDELYLQKEAELMFEDVFTLQEKENRISFNLEAYKMYVKPLQRRAFHLVLNYLYSHNVPKDISYIHEEDFFSLIESSKGTKTLHFPQNLHIERSYEVVSFYFQEEKEDNKLLHTIALPSELEIGRNFTVTAEMTAVKEKEDKYTYYCAVNEVEEPLMIRTRQAGDRIRWPGLNGRKKLSQLFIDEKVPQRKRDDWPIVVDAKGTVLWVIGLKKGLPKQTIGKGPWVKLQVKKQGDIYNA